MRLQNKVGIVTAAASGMGRAGALRFAKEGEPRQSETLAALGSVTETKELPPLA